MALINTTKETPVIHPNKEDVWLKVGAAFLIPTQINKKTTNVQAQFFREIKEGEESAVLEGYTYATECGPFNLGEAQTTGDKSTYWEDIHNFAIEKLGSNFVKL